MRIKHFFGLAVLAAMTASCSSNNDLVNGGGNGSGENETGVSYASFSINLPTTSGTRADDDPNFEHGSNYEYKVNDATLLIFKKGETTKEGDCTFVESAELGSMAPWKDPNETGVTTHAKITAKLETVDKTDGYYALVLLNNGTGNNVKVTLPKKGDTFSTWNVDTNKDKEATNKIANTDNGFYMANAPLFNNNNVTTLVAIDKDKIYPTEEEAAKNAATDVYVERGLAKVTLKTGTAATGKTDDNGAYKVANGAYKDDKVTIENWALDVTNKKTFPIHNVDGLATDYKEIWSNTDTPAGSNGATTQRFVDNKDTKAKRVYWGKDPNYSNTDADKTALKAEFNYVKNEDVKVEPSKPLYCLENTFNLDNMMQGQTTRVVFKAKYTPKGFTDGDTFYKIGKNTAIWKESDLKQEIEAAVASVVSGAAGKITVTLNADKNDITAAGTHYITADNITVTDVEAETIEKAITAINTQLGLKESDKVGISTYTGGESYYIARIKHFGDILTKWTSGTYGEKNLEYLGRYGVLRNNWYELTVQSVSGPGYPSVPEVKPNTPDDEDDKYISVSVKILDWAKRSQNVNL
nr:Mfa1 family fimbria major subunit [uncultured Prevotella sp.]